MRASVRVLKAVTRNESDRCYGAEVVRPGDIGRFCFSKQKVSWSMYVGTRKMVIYACVGRSQVKSWWRSANGSDVQIDRETWV